jgi:excisionase family DNA binding protein
VSMSNETVSVVQMLYRPEEAAQVLRIGRTRLFDLIRSGELRSIKIGNSRRVSATALSEFVERLSAGGEDGAAEQRAN